jgi:hypothetical protein
VGDPRPRPATIRCLTLLAALALTACAKDLELPPLRTAPVLSGLAPAAAYAGQLVRIQGAGLDEDPTANVVGFTGAIARGLRFEGTTLVVRVPDDAGSGPVVVTNGRGTSDPFGPFEYLGLGEPRRRSVATQRGILHHPGAVHGIGGVVFVDSGLYGGLLRADDGAFATPPVSMSAAAPWAGAVFYTVEDPAARAVRLYRVDAAGTTVGPVTLPFAPTQLLPMRVPRAIVAIASQGPELAAWDLDTLGTVIARTPLPLADFAAAADVGDGRAVMVGLDDTFSFNVLSLVRISATPPGGPVPPPVPVGTLPMDAVPTRPPLAVSFSDGRGGVPVGRPLAALALFGGDLAVADLGPAPAFVGTVETFSSAPVEALVGASSVPVVLAAKTDDGLAVGADLVARAALWSVAGAAPSAAAADGDVAFLADRDDNDVAVVNLVTGSRIARVNLDVSPGGGGYAQTAALAPRDPLAPLSEDELFFPSTRFQGLLRYPLGELSPSCVSRAPNVALVAASRDAAALWASHDPATTIDAYLDRGYGAPTAIALAGAPSVAAARGTRLAVGHGTGMSLLDGAAVLGTCAEPGQPLVAIGFSEDGRLWDAAQASTGVRVQRWNPAQLGSGQPDADAVVPTRGLGPVLALEDGIWVFPRGAGSPARLLDDALAPVRAVPVAVDIPAVHAVSPNGRLLVERVTGGAAGETILHFYRADPDAGFPLVDAISVEGNVQGLAFDSSGERLWIVTSAPDRVVLVD